MQPREIGSLVKLKVCEIRDYGVGVVLSHRELLYESMSEDNKHRVYKVFWSKLGIVKPHFEYDLEDV